MMTTFIEKPFVTKHFWVVLCLYLWETTPFCLAEMVYQDFETDQSDLCWTWDQDAVVSSEMVHSGSYSCKLQGVNGNNGIGVKSKLGWHTDFGNHNYLTFWIYALPDREIERENTVLVKFFDHSIYHDTGPEIWTIPPAHYGEWTRLAIPLNQLPKDFNLHDVDKIEFLNYWPGSYYFDDIQIETLLHWDYSRLREGVLQWQPLAGVEQYQLEENTSNNPNDWHVIYEGIETHFTIPRFTSATYRVRVELPYVSNWSQILTSPPLVVLIRHAQLQQGNLAWSPLPQADSYEVQNATNLHGPWNSVYKGPYPTQPLSVLADTWYRVRALGVGEIETTSWSPPQLKPSTIEKGLLRTQGTTIRDTYGNEVTLQGVNLGGFLLNENWLTGLGDGDQPRIEDDWSLREVLQSRFETAAPLLKIYQDAFFKADDCDILMRMGLNIIRLPIFYRNLQDADGNWTTNSQGKIDFETIDRVVNSCADNGIYTLLDLHGAPGSQSNADHTGRANFNKLFEDSPAGEAFRDQTVRIWKEIATHYQNHLAIAGYDLLNEPVGAPNPETLWHLYTRLYQAIRSQDPYHIIVMEGIWYEDIRDWDTLPIPAEQGWENVVYQFHFYNWEHDNDWQAHKDFVDAKLTQGSIKQEQYQVPVMIGEFNGFALPETWEYYLEKFNEKKWSWMLWNYKAHASNSNWGLYTHTGYDELLPKFRTMQADGSTGDSFDDLARKLAKYDTLGHFAPNHTLIEVIQRFTRVPEPDLKINGMDGTVEITQAANNLLITVAVDAKGYLDKPADWWLVELADTAPFDWYHFDYIGGSLSWFPGIAVAHQSPLFNLPSYEIPKLNLPLGNHTFYFGIDLNQNGEVDEPLYYDTVVVNIVK